MLFGLIILSIVVMCNTAPCSCANSSYCTVCVKSLVFNVLTHGAVPGNREVMWPGNSVRDINTPVCLCIPCGKEGCSFFNSHGPISFSKYFSLPPPNNEQGCRDLISKICSLKCS